MQWNQSNQMLVKEHLGLFRAANNYDIFDLATGEKLLECREENLGFFTKLFRFTEYKRFTPFHIEVRDSQGQCVVQIQRGVAIFKSQVTVLDGQGTCIGGFDQKLFTFGRKFEVVDATGNLLCLLEGNWIGWNFNFASPTQIWAKVTKEWGGIGKELFTSADNYVLDVNPSLESENPLRKLILAAVLCIDMVLKE